MRSSVMVAFTPRVLESLACVNTFTSVLGLLSHTARSICEPRLVCWHPECSPKVPSSGVCSAGGNVCHCHHTAGTSIPHWPGRGDFILTDGDETDEVNREAKVLLQPRGDAPVQPLAPVAWRKEILPALAEQVPVCPCCPRDCTASSKPAAARKLFWDMLHLLAFVFIPMLPKLPTNCSWKIESAFLEIGAWLIKDRGIY